MWSPTAPCSSAHDLLLSKGATEAELDAYMRRYWRELQDHRAKVLADFDCRLRLPTSKRGCCAAVKRCNESSGDVR